MKQLQSSLMLPIFLLWCNSFLSESSPQTVAASNDKQPQTQQQHQLERSLLLDRFRQRRRPFSAVITGLVLIDTSRPNATMGGRGGAGTLLRNGQEIVTSSSSDPSFNIEALYSGDGIQFVQFGHGNATDVHREVNQPYLFCVQGPTTIGRNTTGSAQNLVIPSCPALGFGRHTVTATPYGVAAARPLRLRPRSSIQGETFSVTFVIVPDATVAPSSPAPTLPISSDLPTGTTAPTAPLAAPTTLPVSPLPTQETPDLIPLSTDAPKSAAKPVPSPGLAPQTQPTAKTSSPVAAVAPLPLGPPTHSPVVKSPKKNATQCPKPNFNGSQWQTSKAYPIWAAEAQGALLDNGILLLVSGFNNSWSTTTTETYGFDTTNKSSSWKRYDDQPVPKGITHTGFVVVNGTTFYMCGGYVGANEGPSTGLCLALDIFKPSGQQWSTLPSLPGLGQGGGGMVYDSAMNALIVAGGAKRVVGSKETHDVNYTWMYSFDKPKAGWVAKAPIPYKGNHLSFVTVPGSDSGSERHFFAGGQAEEDEGYGNLVHHVEYVASTDTWVQRQSLPFPRGHSSSSTRAMGCSGYIMVGGTTNGYTKLADVTFYDVSTDAWIKLASLPSGINTPVCDVHRQTLELYCESGSIDYSFSYKRSFSWVQ